jgi:acyl-CoA synthetase (AMP-forming)/AMP-acid ligase II
MEFIPSFPGYAPTLPNVIADAARRHDGREFLVDGARRYTFREAERVSAEFARGLLALGVGKGARVALVMPDTADWVLAWWAAARIGALTIPLSTFFQPKELDWALKEADIDTLFLASSYLGRDYVERLERAVPDLAGQTSTRIAAASHPYLRNVVVWGECDRPWAIKGSEGLRAQALAAPAIDDALLRQAEGQVAPSDLLLGICTSGSTAAPKIVIHTHGSMIRTAHFLCATFLGLRPDERNYSGMPLFWLGGFNCNLMPAIFEGACMVFSESPRPEDVLDLVLREKLTRVMMWPQQYKPLADLAARRGVDISHTMANLNFNGPDGKPIPPERRIVTLLGMTETFGPHGYGQLNEQLPEGKGGSWGTPVRGIERKIVDPQTGATLPPGQQGELCIRGFSLMDGYYKRERSEVFDAEGWFHTGDTCSIDADGYLFFSGRVSDMIKTTGANVSPLEVERLMVTYPGVAEALAVGMPDAERGERVVAVVVPKQGENVDPEALRRRMLEDISSYKVPKSIVVMSYDEVPRTTSGKAQKNALKGLLAERLAAKPGA